MDNSVVQFFDNNLPDLGSLSKIPELIQKLETESKILLEQVCFSKLFRKNFVTFFLSERQDRRGVS
jgi:hypothetical protein